MEVYWGVKGWLQTFLTTAVNETELSISCLGWKNSRRLGLTQSRFGLCGEEQFLSPTGIELCFFGHPDVVLEYEIKLIDSHAGSTKEKEK
jgi:hypothetical protein